MTISKMPRYKISDNDFVVKSEAQHQFLKADFDNVQEVLLTGPGGTGKTVSLLISSLGPQKNGKLLIEESSYVGVVIRREATQLEKSGLINAATEWYTKFDKNVQYNGSLRKFTFSSGAQIWFRGVESEEDALKFKGYTRLHFLGVEELTQFTEKQFDLISTRLRDASNKIPLRIRCTTNAGDTGEEWVLDRYKYWLYQSCVFSINTPIKASYGQALFTYIDENDPDLPRIITDTKPSLPHEKFMCIETKIDDIMKDNLQTLGKISDPILRAQLMQHKWGLKPEGGMYFSEQDFKIVESKPRIASRIRYWDKAASGKRGDWLAGLLLARTPDDKYIIEDVILTKAEVHQVKNIIYRTACNDGKSIVIAIEQEGGSAGKETSYEYEKMFMKEGYQILIDVKTANKNTSSKLQRAAIVSPIVKEGRVGILSGGLSWKNEFMKQLSAFPSKGVHDDAVDCFSGAYYLLSTRIPAPLAMEGYNQFLSNINNALPNNFYAR